MAQRLGPSSSKRSVLVSGRLFRHLTSRRWGAYCSSAPTTILMARSCGSRTAPRLAPPWSRISPLSANPNPPISRHWAARCSSVPTAVTVAKLWMSDGTTDGTLLVQDMNPGDASADPPISYASGRPCSLARKQLPLAESSYPGISSGVPAADPALTSLIHRSPLASAERSGEQRSAQSAYRCRGVCWRPRNTGCGSADGGC